MLCGLFFPWHFQLVRHQTPVSRNPCIRVDFATFVPNKAGVWCSVQLIGTSDLNFSIVQGLWAGMCHEDLCQCHSLLCFHHVSESDRVYTP